MSATVAYYHTPEEADRAKRHLESAEIAGATVAEVDGGVYEVRVPDTSEPAALKAIERLEEGSIEDFF